MKDKAIEYVENARKNEQKIERRYSNGLDYIFIYEADGWISIFDVTGGIYTPKIQAKDIEHAESYITFIEPLPPFVNVIE